MLWKLLILVLSANKLSAESIFRRVDAKGNTITAGDQMGLLLYHGGTVCDDSFNITAAHAICKVMGFEGALQWFSGSKWSIQVQFDVLINHVKCPLPIWSTCGYINGNCGHHEDIFLTCSIRTSSVFRLVDSSGNTMISEGQKGLLLHNEGTVSDQHFNMKAAQAICKVMGFENALQWTQGQRWKIQQAYPILTENIMCPLSDWSSCNYTDSHATDHTTDVFLSCLGTRSTFSLVDKRGFTVSGSQEFLLLHNGGTICGNAFSNNSANAACKDMGYSGFKSWRVGPSWGNYRISLDNMNCTEGKFSTCKYTTSHDCEHGNEIFISCDSCCSETEEEESSVFRESTTKRKEVNEAEVNLTIGILTLACTVLVALLVKKNAQIDEILKSIKEIKNVRCKTSAKHTQT